MIKSMTGFGKAECELATRKISVEIKSLNSKTLDIYTKIPGIYRQKELEIRNELSKSLQRGKIEFILFYEYTDDSKATTINSGVVRNYIHQLKSISDELSINSQEQLLQIAMRLPDTLNIEREEIDEADWEKIQGTIKQAIEQLDNFRIQEGKHLLDDFISRIEIIEKYKNEITPFELARTVKIKEKINESLRNTIDEKDVDKNRFEQEIIYYLEKLDITEEKVRLTNHCKYFKEVVNEAEPSGKKLGFITQEIGREINTIGSKANDYDIQKIVVLMKDELEKIKEQGLNIL
ncbi:MAG: YicC family protein [Bacteroidetes bacterium GWC2_33_15]|nr:MAG: YicC family protein [Bacteroidetes bacterium GWA2_33_15]OFX51177.1 MAG: YicC family protein [Bacteroidetes bacterium GWC2_33_15]OFX65679.1 MAG: YicC family protein [Bacteroidetes bacterium GWB2_32_14]OFX70385.1 MAG: YicC family protein [Bacteroidetes bacterium GWD2_33_33]HAN17229.1 YicC family protein [Bacteroidales bacterium]